MIINNPKGLINFQENCCGFISQDILFEIGLSLSPSHVLPALCSQEISSHITTFFLSQRGHDSLDNAMIRVSRCSSSSCTSRPILKIISFHISGSILSSSPCPHSLSKLSGSFLRKSSFLNVKVLFIPQYGQWASGRQQNNTSKKKSFSFDYIPSIT